MQLDVRSVVEVCNTRWVARGRHKQAACQGMGPAPTQLLQTMGTLPPAAPLVAGWCSPKFTAAARAAEPSTYNGASVLRAAVHGQ